jgi:hypothetical protein
MQERRRQAQRRASETRDRAVRKHQAQVEGQLEARIKTLIALGDQVFVKDPWAKRSVNEAIDPIRNVK